MKTRYWITVALGLGWLALSLGGNCIQRSALNEPTAPVVVPGTVVLRNDGGQAVHLVLLNEQADAANLVQPGETRTVDVDLAAVTANVVAFAPNNPLPIGGIDCTISTEVDGAITPTGVEIVWTGLGLSGFECR